MARLTPSRRRLTFILLGSAAVLLLLLISGVQESSLFRVTLRSGSTAGTVAAEGASRTVSGTMVQTQLIKPHYTGQDASGRRWEITAATATQEGAVRGSHAASASVVILNDISATYAGTATDQLAGPTPAGADARPVLTLSAQHGTYSSNTLVLRQNVVMTGQGYTLTTPALTADMSTRTATGNQGVQVFRDGATLAGDNFTVDHANQHVTLSGNVRARFVAGQMKQN